MQEMRVQSLGWEDLLEEEMATHYNILAKNKHHQLSFVAVTIKLKGDK